MDLSFFTSADVVNNAAAVPIIVALVQLFKMVDPEGKFSRFAPFISIGVGVLICFFNQDARDHDQQRDFIWDFIWTISKRTI